MTPSRNSKEDIAATLAYVNNIIHHFHMIRVHFSASVLQAECAGVLHCAAERLTEPLQVPFDLVFKVKFTAEFFLRVKNKKKKKNHLLYVSQLYTHSRACTHARRARTLLKWLSAAFAITAAPQLHLPASPSPRVPSEPTDLDAWADTGLRGHSPPERHFCYATSPNGSKLKP